MLKVLLLKKKLDTLRTALTEKEARCTELRAEEENLEKAINEAETDEERNVVEEAVEAHETATREAEEEKANLEREIADLEKELEAEEAKQVPENTLAPTDATPTTDERKEKNIMNKREFFGMNIAERNEFFAREDVKEFLLRVRNFGKEERAVTGGELLIPEIIVGLIKENVIEYSKLLRHINLKQVSGKARQTVAGAIPEAVWTEACGKLNELNLNFYGEEVDAYKVGGYIAVCNALLEDSDINLAEEVIEALARAIGYALDKAILYGTGTKMPLGIVTRLVQTSEPASYPSTRRPWVDLHTSNVKSIANTAHGTDLFKELIKDSGAAKSKYSRGIKTWAMNEATYTTLIAESTAFNAAGAVVSGLNGVMPVIGGDIVVLDFVPDNVIVGGYFDLYLLAERGETALAQSKEVQFIEDNTVFKGTARYDGTPVIDEAFVAIGINGVTPNASMTFAEDTANF